MPFTPRSNVHLRPGQFWALPLRDGRFGCGRVLAVPAFGPKDRRGFVAGLLDWTGARPPVVEDIVDRPVLEHGSTRIEAIVNTGGEVAGWRPLTADALAGIDADGVGSTRVWGWRTIVNLAERRFVDGETGT